MKNETVEFSLKSIKIPGQPTGKIHVALAGKSNDIASLLVYALENHPDLIEVFEAALKFAKLSDEQKEEYIKNHPPK